jgi:hypothetical protein
MRHNSSSSSKGKTLNKDGVQRTVILYHFCGRLVATWNPHRYPLDRNFIHSGIANFGMIPFACRNKESHQCLSLAYFESSLDPLTVSCFLLLPRCYPSVINATFPDASLLNTCHDACLCLYIRQEARMTMNGDRDGQVRKTMGLALMSETVVPHQPDHRSNPIMQIRYKQLHHASQTVSKIRSAYMRQAHRPPPMCPMTFAALVTRFFQFGAYMDTTIFFLLLPQQVSATLPIKKR